VGLSERRSDDRDRCMRVASRANVRVARGECPLRQRRGLMIFVTIVKSVSTGVHIWPSKYPRRSVLAFIYGLRSTLEGQYILNLLQREKVLRQ